MEHISKPPGISVPTAEVGTARPIARIDELAARAADHARHALSPATAKAYRVDWADFECWCTKHGLVSLPAPPQVVGMYLTDRASNLTVATLKRRLVSISRAHRLANLYLDARHPAIRDVYAGIRRGSGTATRYQIGAAPVDRGL